MRSDDRLVLIEGIRLRPSGSAGLVEDADASLATSVRTLASAPGLRGKPVLFVPDNHEFFGGQIERRLQKGL